jgi:hypothetical protein
MENRSAHYGDVAKWIEKVIDSCETWRQTLTARKLINNFRNQLMRDTPDKYWNSYQYEVIWPLDDMVERKREELVKQSKE